MISPKLRLLTLLILVLLLVACGGNNTSSTNNTGAATNDNAAAANPTTPPQPAADIALRWRTRPDNQEEANVYATVSATLDQQLEGISLTYEPGGSETASYQDVLKTEIANGTAPDVFWIPGTDVADFATRGLILNLASLAGATSGFSVDAFYPGPMFHLTYNPDSMASGGASGALWGLPRDVSTFALYLNLDLIAEAGAPDPRELAANGQWDWQAFLEVAQAVHALGPDIYGYGANAWWGPYGTWMNAAGGGFFNEDRTACNLDSAESLAGLAFEQALYQEYNVAVPYGEDSEPPFRAGKVAMFQNGRWATPGTRTVTFDWDVVELPKGPAGNAGNWLFWGAYVVNGSLTGERAEAAWKLVQALTTAETQATVAALGANIPSRVSQEAFDAFLTYTPPANNQAFLNGLADSPATEGPLWAGSWPEYAPVMDAAVQALMTGSSTLEQFAATVCNDANRAAFSR
ncbi:MAG: sugar ABC transporter substrate-binding protein [Anaerolineae bacterium]|nr:sugar ABC transporter substrate-binding protein [Anaerolineae bacterium]